MELVEHYLYEHAAKVEARVVIDIIQNALFAMSLLVFLSGTWTEDAIIQFVGIFVMFIANVLHACIRLETRLFSLVLHAGMFLFWITRPLFGTIYLHDFAWKNNDAPSLAFALFAIIGTMFFIRLGTSIYERFLSRKTNHHRIVPAIGKRMPLRLESVAKRHQHDSGTFRKALQIASLLLYLICYAGTVIYGFQMLSFMRGMLYEEFYLTNPSVYSSGAVSFLNSMAPYALCFYLATLPKKTPSTVVLLLNITTSVPTLLIGGRGPFVLSVVFLCIYYLIRAFICKEDGWITRWEILVVCIGLPLGILGMGAITYLRGGHSIAPENILGSFCDALYKQGVSFNVLQYGYAVDPQIDNLGFKFFLLGPLTHTITQGFVGQLFLNYPKLPETNSLELALNGTYYSHTMSYFTNSNYLQGEGFGTSYVLEAYADFGYIGIAIVSLILGFVFAFLSHRAKDGCFAAILFEMLAAQKVFFLPRSEAVSWLSFAWSTRFWLMAIAIILIAIFIAHRLNNAGQLKAKISDSDSELKHYS